ncbi:MAG: hypothetical protein ACYCYP_12575 [Leptospirales bacterium]
MKEFSEIDPCNECGIPSREAVCETCEDPHEDLPGIPIILTILISGILLVAGLVIAIGKVGS